MTRVVGLDPSLTGTGIAGRGWSLAVGAPGNVEKDPYPLRLGRINVLTARIWDAIAASGAVDLVVMEAAAFDARSTSAHDRAGLWWFIYDHLCQAGIPVVTVTTGGLKKYATGKGSARKTQVVEQVVRRFGTVWEDLGGDDNRADAVVLCAMGLDWAGQPVAPVPATHRAALDAVKWPTRGVVRGEVA